MLAIIDSRSSSESLDKLSEYVDDIHLFASVNQTYASISCHPDIFMYQDSENLVLAPNSPDSIIEFLDKHNVNYRFGRRCVTEDLIGSTAYNCLSTANYLFHKNGHTDEVVVELNQKRLFVNLPQAYTRCSLFAYGNNQFITSDKGIEKVLSANLLSSFYFSPEHIQIYDHKHGFIGGCIGRIDRKIFFNGNPARHADGGKLLELLDYQGHEAVCLSDDFLYDGGGIFFVREF